jgi:phosphate-selective porin
VFITIGLYASAPKKNPIYTYDNESISVNLGAGLLFDYTFFSQDDDSKEQVGRQDNKFDVRVVRTAAYGMLKFMGPWSYVFILEHNDYIENDSDTVSDVMNLELTYHFIGSNAKITIGKMKEPYVYEMVGDSASLPHHERVLTPMFQGRNVGIRYSNTYDKMGGTFAIGVYNDYIEEHNSISDNGTQISTRLTKLLWIDETYESYLHVGASIRYNEATNNVLRYMGKPESNVADYYLDTGDINANYSIGGALEGVASYKGYSFLSEYVQNRINSDTLNSPSFKAYYVLASWVPTGEGRPYDKLRGYGRRIIPKSKYGALEYFFRYGKVDLDSAGIKGGILYRHTYGINWWIDDKFKASVSYGYADLKRFDENGRTETLLFRLQWLQF